LPNITPRNLTRYVSKVRKRVLPIGPMVLLAVLLLPALVSAPYVEAQGSATVAAEPLFINLGLTTSIVVKSPEAGNYTVVVTKPDGASQAELNYSFVEQNETRETYGNATMGFRSVIDQVGTYRVSLRRGGEQVTEATFFATDKLVLDLTVANSGTSDNVCYISNQFTRGTSIVPRIYVQYASTGEYMTLADSPKAVVTFTLPNGTKMQALFASYLPPKGAWRNCFRQNWDDYAGPWNITAEASDGKGNYGIFVSYPTVTLPLRTGPLALRFGYEILPAPLTVTASVLDAATGKNATTTLSAGQRLRIEAKVEYLPPLGPLSREWPEGYLGLLNTTRGGVVTAKLGWGFYNETAKTFGGKSPGGLVATIPLTYSEATGLWVGTYNVTGTEPKGDYMAVVEARDRANPPNTGTGRTALFQVVEKVVEVPVERIVERIVEVVPVWAYGAMAGLLVIGAIVGVAVTRRK